MSPTRTTTDHRLPWQVDAISKRMRALATSMRRPCGRGAGGGSAETPVRPASATTVAWMLAAFALSALHGPVEAAPAVVRFEGEAHAAGDGRLLYREMHLRGGERHVVLYRCADGQAFARKQLWPEAAPSSPRVLFEDARSGRRQGVRDVAGGREVFVRERAGAAERTAMLARPWPVIDAGFDAWLREAWPEPGERIETAFLAPGRLSALPFRAQATDTGDIRRFRLSLAAWYGGLAPRIEVDYDRAGRQLSRYRGPSDVPDARGRAPDVEIRFPVSARGPATAADIDAALQVPLVAQCVE